jgi:hypothetical protein
MWQHTPPPHGRRSILTILSILSILSILYDNSTPADLVTIASVDRFHFIIQIVDSPRATIKLTALTCIGDNSQPLAPGRAVWQI